MDELMNNDELDTPSNEGIELPCYIMSEHEFAQMEIDKEILHKKICDLLDEFEDKYPTMQLAVHTRLYVENRPYNEEEGGACQIHAFDYTWKDKRTKYIGITKMG